MFNQKIVIMKTKRVILTFLVILSFFSCKKEPGPQGPEGPEGPQGPPGNANVITATYTLSYNDWFTVDQHLEADIRVDTLSMEIVNSGLVKVYMKNEDGYSWENLPLIRVYDTYTSYYNYMYAYQRVTITKYDSDNNPIAPYSEDFKIVIIPKATLSKYPNFDWNKYCDSIVFKELNSSNM